MGISISADDDAAMLLMALILNGCLLGICLVVGNWQNLAIGSSISWQGLLGSWFAQ